VGPRDNFQTALSRVQAPVTAAVVIAAAITSSSSTIGIERGLHQVAEVVFGCLVGMTGSQLMSKVWLIQPRTEQTDEDVIGRW
jgi:hypothetical protein